MSSEILIKGGYVVTVDEDLRIHTRLQGEKQTATRLFRRRR